MEYHVSIRCLGGGLICRSSPRQDTCPSALTLSFVGFRGFQSARCSSKMASCRPPLGIVPPPPRFFAALANAQIKTRDPNNWTTQLCGFPAVIQSRRARGVVFNYYTAAPVTLIWLLWPIYGCRGVSYPGGLQELSTCLLIL